MFRRSERLPHTLQKRMFDTKVKTSGTIKTKRSLIVIWDHDRFGHLDHLDPKNISIKEMEELDGTIKSVIEQELNIPAISLLMKEMVTNEVIQWKKEIFDTGYIPGKFNSIYPFSKWMNHTNIGDVPRRTRLANLLSKIIIRFSFGQEICRLFYP